MTCPFCTSADSERVGQWGRQMITAQWRCRACGSYFEAIRDEFAGDLAGTDQAAERPRSAPSSSDAK